MKRVILTYRYRIKDATTAKPLRAHARAVNYVWNYCGEIQEAARRQEKRWPSVFDLIKLTTDQRVPRFAQRYGAGCLQAIRC